MPSENRSPGQDFNYDQIQQSIDKANKIEIIELFKANNIPIDSWNKKACCPLPDHSGGKERTPSFYYYEDTNSFYCFGCKAYGGPVEFLSKLEGYTKYKASLLLLKGYQPSLEGKGRREDNARSILEFSHLMREFIMSNPDKFEDAERFAKAFDEIRFRRSLSEKEYDKLINNIKKKLYE